MHKQWTRYFQAPFYHVFLLRLNFAVCVIFDVVSDALGNKFVEMENLISIQEHPTIAKILKHCDYVESALKAKMGSLTAYNLERRESLFEGITDQRSLGSTLQETDARVREGEEATRRYVSFSVYILAGIKMHLEENNPCDWALGMRHFDSRTKQTAYKDTKHENTFRINGRRYYLMNFSEGNLYAFTAAHILRNSLLRIMENSPSFEFQLFNDKNMVAAIGCLWDSDVEIVVDEYTQKPVENSSDLEFSDESEEEEEPRILHCKHTLIIICFPLKITWLN